MTKTNDKISWCESCVKASHISTSSPGPKADCPEEIEHKQTLLVCKYGQPIMIRNFLLYYFHELAFHTKEFVPKLWLV